MVKQEGIHGRFRQTYFIIFTDPRETDIIRWVMREVPIDKINLEVMTKQGSRYLWTSDITGGLGGVTQGKGKGGLCCCIWMSLGHREGWEEEFVAGNKLTTLVHLIVCVGRSHPICRDVEAAGKPEIQQLWYRNWTVGLKELEMIYNKGSIFSVLFDLSQGGN